MPPYFKKEIIKTLASVRSAVDEPALVFPMVTDIHYLSGRMTTFDVCAKNMKCLCDRLICDFIMNLGDNTDGNVPQDVTLKRAKYMNEQFAKCGIPYYMTIGNHDTNYYQNGYNFTGVQTFSAYLSDTRGVHFEDNAYHISFYKDFDWLGVRVIVLNVDYLDSYKVSADTISWFETKALNTNYTVLLCEHLSSVKTQNWNAQNLGNGVTLTSKIEAFINNGGTLIQICGHSHADYYFNDPWFTVFSGCQKMEQPDTTAGNYLDISGNIGGNAGIVAPSRTMGTVTEDLWNVCVLKPISKELDFIRFGAGVDRYFHYDRHALTSGETFTSRLTGSITWGTSDANVATVANGVVTSVGTGICQITATDSDGNYETWTVVV
jgi:hypothetical protein